ncbi:ArnT family glycosyltransferase [uncultured Friedmanniella sp.]|uniref:ArnT family glycosyltransferase n=1 Tax=uncultured Friedmanniella sp. TaxID=335381 RepID=UPI0035CAE40A
MPATALSPDSTSLTGHRLTRASRPATDPAAPATRRRGRLVLRSVITGADRDPRWAQPLLWLLLLGTAALYLVNLSSSGTANEFYAAAVKSGTESLKAWLFGSLDSGNAITVDKPPVSLWVMVLSARIFGFSSFSMLLPQALMGVGSVAVTYAAVKRWSGPAAGLIAGALLALTPVAALMFRFNNPDALLVLLMAVAAYGVVRAIDAASETARHAALRWMLVAGAAIGFAFLTKMAQGLLVLPAFGLVYLVASPLRLKARIGHLLAATGAMVVSAGWFVALVALWPTASRPYIGGSTSNSLWELAIGYNGLGRIFGATGNGGGGMGGGGNTSFGGATGITRLLGTAFGTQISWFLPAALIALVAGLVLTWRAPRTDRTRAGLLLWGGWLIVTGLVFSFMSGTIHPYYAVALAPAIGGLVAIGGRELWRARTSDVARTTLALMVTGTAVWGWYLMDRDASGWSTWLAWTMLVGGVLGALVLVASTGRLKKLAVAALLVGAISASLGAASFTTATVSTGHTGSTPSAGPSSVASAHLGGMGGSSTTDTALVDLLNATSSRWSAAVVGDQSATGYILSTDTAVMAIGGWGGTDNSPTLAQFQAYVASGDVGYFIAGSNGGGGGTGGGGMGSGGMGGGGNSSSSGSEITAWVEAHYTATSVGGATVYDLTAG